MGGALDDLPDVRDGLTRLERAVLLVLHRLREERGDRRFATAEIYGRVCELLPVSVEQLQATLVRLGAGQHNVPAPPREPR